MDGLRSVLRAMDRADQQDGGSIWPLVGQVLDDSRLSSLETVTRHLFL
jgi:hypothetical protein